MSEKFKVEIISPSETILKLDTSEVIIPSYEGSHLKRSYRFNYFFKTRIIHIKNEPKIDYFIEEGIVEFANNTNIDLDGERIIKYRIKFNKNLIIDAEK